MVSIRKLHVIVFNRETHNALIQFVIVTISEPIRKHYVLLPFDWIKINWNKWRLLSNIKYISTFHCSKLNLSIKRLLLASLVVDLYSNIISPGRVSDTIFQYNHLILILLFSNLHLELSIFARTSSANSLNVPLIVKYFISIFSDEIVPELWIHGGQNVCTGIFVCDYLKIDNAFSVANHLKVIISAFLSFE